MTAKSSILCSLNSPFHAKTILHNPKCLFTCPDPTAVGRAWMWVKESLCSFGGLIPVVLWDRNSAGDRTASTPTHRERRSFLSIQRRYWNNIISMSSSLQLQNLSRNLPSGCYPHCFNGLLSVWFIIPNVWPMSMFPFAKASKDL